jgi:hypothetical protein
LRRGGCRCPNPGTMCRLVSIHNDAEEAGQVLILEMDR